MTSDLRRVPGGGRYWRVSSFHKLFKKATQTACSILTSCLLIRTIRHFFKRKINTIGIVLIWRNFECRSLFPMDKLTFYENKNQNLLNRLADGVNDSYDLKKIDFNIGSFDLIICFP